MLFIDRVSRHFDAVQALNNVSFTIQPGRVHGIIGPNGSGKTTLFNCISGLLELSSGNIFLDEKKISGLPAHEIARMGIRRTFQQGPLVPTLTVMENVMVGLFDCRLDSRCQNAAGVLSGSAEQQAREAAAEMLQFIGMPDSGERWASDLVWAERQMVQIARAAVSRPRIILMDEPAAGMGSAEARQAGRLINSLKDMDITPVVVSHNMKMLMSTAETVTVLNFGRIIFEGEPAEAQNDPEVLEAYLGPE